MSQVARLFARTSVVYLVATAIGGVYLFVDRNHPTQLRSAHSHLLLIGWLTMGVAAALLAKGRHSDPVARAGWLLSNVGLLSMTAAWITETQMMANGLTPYFAAAGLVEVVGLFLVGVAVWQAVGDRPAAGTAPSEASDRHDSV